MLQYRICEPFVLSHLVYTRGSKYKRVEERLRKPHKTRMQEHEVNAGEGMSSARVLNKTPL
jgi:hypothetical protein